jgi:hypothetical protein
MPSLKPADVLLSGKRAVTGNNRARMTILRVGRGGGLEPQLIVEFEGQAESAPHYPPSSTKLFSSLDTFRSSFHLIPAHTSPVKVRDLPLKAQFLSYEFSNPPLIIHGKVITD